MFKHKDGSWKWDSFKTEYARQQEPFAIGILLKTLIVIDLDVADLQAEWEGRFPILQSCPKQNTKKGVHYILGRTAKCDQLGLYDKAG